MGILNRKECYRKQKEVKEKYGENYKYCNTCGCIKNIEEFSFLNKKKGYRQNKCKSCGSNSYKKWNKENKEHKLTYNKRWREKNKGHIKSYNKKWENSSTKLDIFYQYLLPYYEDRIRKDKEGYIEVKCEYNKCQKWFKPTYRQVRNRWDAICGKFSDCSENNIYCSNNCKNKCEKYRQKPEDLIKEDEIRAGRLNWIELNREVQPELRQMVLKRDGYTCQKCGSTEHLHCHHIFPASIEPIESADVDNCITYCKECHKEAHMQDGCKYGQLRNCIE